MENYKREMNPDIYRMTAIFVRKPIGWTVLEQYLKKNRN